jgi:predicted RecA/RadA family phage recombinase
MSSKAAFWQRGESLDYKNTSNAAIEANSVIVFGKRIAVAGMTIQPGEIGTIHVTGVFRFSKAAEEITAGAEVYYSEKDGTITTTSASNTLAGFAVEAAGASDDTVIVKINA